MTTRRAYKRWSRFEINYLHDALPELPLDHIAEILGRSIKAVEQKACNLRVNSRSEGSEGYTVRSLARVLEAQPVTVLRRVKSGDLKAVRRRLHKHWSFRRGGDYFITDEDVGALWAENPDDVIFSNAPEDWLAELPIRNRR